ncbi:hypothetical protein XENORESO_000996 [Xenotaenia resolanae]|uniref:Uncharacterized protein n=1 Tax=Xenotaenia resolanae TaxID=208358 RepID=A0ABV0WBV3_9TELE
MCESSLKNLLQRKLSAGLCGSKASQELHKSAPNLHKAEPPVTGIKYHRSGVSWWKSDSISSAGRLAQLTCLWQKISELSLQRHPNDRTVGRLIAPWRISVAF